MLRDNNTTTDQYPVAWGQLVQALKSGEAVLIIGPGVEEVVMPQGETRLLQAILSNRLGQQIKQRQPDLLLSHPDNLSYVAQHFEDAHGKQATTLLGESVREFYEQYHRETLPIYRQVANLHFRCIINTNPNKLIVTAYEEEGYLLADSNFAYYHYLNPNHNQTTRIEETNISEETPLIYNLFGIADDPSSLVLTETQQLNFIETVLQTDKDTIPPGVAIQFMSRRNSPINKRLVFVGFDFNDWRLRIILYLINRYQAQGALKSYAPQNLDSLDKLTQFFYQRNFNFDFIPSNSGDFLSKLTQEYQSASTPKTTAAPQLRLFIMYHEADEATCTDLEEHLALLKRNGLVEVWHTRKMTAGMQTDREINNQINAANLILLIVSSDFLASDHLYNDQLQTALQRQKNGQAVVIPIIAKPCAWEGAVFHDLKTILPSPRGRRPLYAADSPSSEAALAQLAKEIEIICRKLLDRLAQTQ